MLVRPYPSPPDVHIRNAQYRPPDALPAVERWKGIKAGLTGLFGQDLGGRLREYFRESATGAFHLKTTRTWQSTSGKRINFIKAYKTR
jgi:hypothetical protein